MKPARYHPDAVDELRAAIRYGELDRPGRGALLEAAVNYVLRRIRRHPQSAPRWPGLQPSLEIRKARVKRHPFIVVYIVLADQIAIVAVAHTSKEPGYWRGRLRDVAR